MVESFITPDASGQIQTVFRRLEKTIEVVFWDTHWVSFLINRPDSPDAYGQDVWIQVGEGEGRLRDTGVIEPSTQEGILMPEAPFRLKTLISAGLTSDNYLLIENRLFKVEAFKPRAGDRTHANAYLRELFYADLPSDGEVVNASGLNS